MGRLLAERCLQNGNIKRTGI